MTVIAWDGKTLAADRRAVNGGLARTTRKIQRRADGNVLLAMSGQSEVALEMVEWFISPSRDPKEFPAAARDGGATLLVISRSGVGVSLEAYTMGPCPTVFTDEQFAIGSGRDYAIAAMHLGRTAREAVEVACLFDVDCGNGIDTLELAP